MDASLQKLKAQMQSAIENAVDIERCATDHGSLSVAHQVYFTTTRARLACGRIFLAWSMKECDAPQGVLAEISSKACATPSPLAPSVASSSAVGASSLGGASPNPKAATKGDEKKVAAEATPGPTEATPGPTETPAAGDAKQAGALETQATLPDGGDVEPSSAAACSAPAASPAKSVASSVTRSGGRDGRGGVAVSGVQMGPLTIMLQQGVFADGKARLPVQSPELLFNYFDLESFVSRAIDIETVERLIDCRDTWTTVFGMASQLKESLAKSAAKMKQALDTLRRAKEREKSAKAKDAEKQEVSRVKRVAHLAAERIKEDQTKARNILAIPVAEHAGCPTSG